MFPLLIITCIVAILTITDALQVIKQQPTSFLSSKRDVLKRGIIATAAIIDGGASFSLSSKALDPVGRIRDSKDGLLSPYDVAEMLRPVPTFTIVDKAGVPFTVVGEDAKVTGYFFTTFPEADRILRLAKTSAKKAIAKTKVDDPQTNPWNQARISTVPLDYAVTLVSKSNRIFFKIAPAEDDVKNALAVTGDDDLSEGKVPLFYYDDDSTIDTKLYFRKNQLEQEWRQLHPKNDSLPKTNVTELFSLLSELVRPGGTDNELKNLIFVPPKESMQKSIECLKKGGTEPPFVVGKSIIVL
jgi:hypothetical protein